MPAMPDSQEGLSWRVARRCNGGACVQVAATSDGILIGSSLQPEGPVIACSPAEWAAFVEGIRQGDFDDLL
jgi:predicted secreted Zn-dependent protease